MIEIVPAKYFLFATILLLHLLAGLIILIIRLRTRHKKDEEILTEHTSNIRESEERYRLLIKNAPICVHEIDMSGRFTSMNDAGLAMMGVEHESEVCGLSYVDAACEEDKPRISELIEKAYLGEASFFQFMSVPDNEGNQLFFDSNFIPIKDENGEVVKLMGVTQDFTLRAKAEQELQNSESRFRELANLLPLTVFESNAAGNFTYTNEMGFKLFGYTPDDLAKGVNISDIVAAQDLERAMSNIVIVLGGETPNNNQYLAVRKDGSEFPALIYSQRILKDEQVIGLRGVVVDISERERMEEDIRKNQNLESLGILAGGIAHDFNNLMTVVSGSLELLDARLEAGSIEAELIATARNASDRTTGLSHQLLTFARGGEPIRTPVHLEKLLRETVDLSLRGSKSRASIDVERALSIVNVDVGQISQVIQNLVINANQAMPNGGVVEVQAVDVQINDLDSFLPTGNYVQISISDSGVGIAEDILPKIFDPYFSTKSAGHGLGLSISYSIVRKHGGEILVDSSSGTGSTFRVLIPASDKSEQKTMDSALVELGGTANILVMDDQDLVLNITEMMLESMGVNVVCTQDGTVAVDAFRMAYDRGVGFDVVILDLTVPGGMGGLEALKQILAIDRNAKVIVSSGYYDDPVLKDYHKYGFAAVLQKPMSLKSLRCVLNNLLPQPSGNSCLDS